MTTLEKEPMMELAEVARYLRISRSMLYKFTAKNLIPFHRIGGRLRFRFSEIEAWIAASDHQAGQS